MKATRMDTSSQREEFFRSKPGRLATATGGFVLLGIGLLAAAGPGSHVLYIISAIPMLAIVASIFSVGLAVMEGYEEEPFFILFSFPFLAGLGLAAMYAAPTAGSLFGALFASLGALVIAVSARGLRRAPALEPATTH